MRWNPTSLRSHANSYVEFMAGYRRCRHGAWQEYRVGESAVVVATALHRCDHETLSKHPWLSVGWLAYEAS